MKMWKVVLPAAAFLLLVGQAAAQTEEDERRQESEQRAQEIEEKLKLAEERMAEAAREIAIISKERLPRIAEIEKRFAWSSRPRLGITIEPSEDSGPVDGITILGVSPGSAASDAGLRSGDIVTSVNGESLKADNSRVANERLLDFMSGVEEGDVLKVDYLRDGKSGSVEVEPRIVANNTFIFSGEGGPMELHVPSAPISPEMVERFKMEFSRPWVHAALGDLELVELNEGLGRYFGTDRGLLVVKAPKSGAFDLRDGDVIQNIDGREPKDVRHAMRILGSYAAGEKLEMSIMRDKKRVKVDVEMPADFHGSLQQEFQFEVRPAVAPNATPAPAAVPLPDTVASVVIDLAT
jgi:S1-C subfamily serine protease